MKFNPGHHDSLIIDHGSYIIIDTHYRILSILVHTYSQIVFSWSIICRFLDENAKKTTNYRTAMAAWKYINPVDSNTINEINGTTWKICNQCVYSVTCKVGFHNKTHTTSQHGDPAQPAAAAPPLLNQPRSRQQILRKLKRSYRKMQLQILTHCNGKASTALERKMHPMSLVLEEFSL